MAITAIRALRTYKRSMDTAIMRKRGSTETISRQVCVTSIKILRSGVRRKFHAPLWSSGRRSDPSTDCNRNNLTCRQCNGRLSRKVLSFSKDLTWLEKHLWLSLAYYHFVLPHDSLRQRIPQPQPTRGRGSPKKWQPVTPAMAADLTDHVWTMEELLSYRVPPDFRNRLDQQATNDTA